jgi:hypothetical protein
MYSASSTSGRSGSKQSRTPQSATNTFSVEREFGGKAASAIGGGRQADHPMATGDGHS